MPNKKKNQNMGGGFFMGSRATTAPVKKEVETADPWKNHHARQFLSMSTKERRKLYKCGRNFKKIEDIPMWAVFDKVQMRTAGKRKREDTFPIDIDIAKKVSLWQGDITSLEVDAIVNAANNTLLGGGGVDGCIHNAAGNTLVNECRTLDGCDTGFTKITGGHKLPARYILHTVGPRGRKPELLKSCYESCLQIARERNLKTIAFCCISTGIFGYPNEDAAHMALETVRKWLEEYGDEVERIIFCTFLKTDWDIYTRLMSTKYFPCGKQEEEEEGEEEGEKEKKEGVKKKNGKSQEAAKKGATTEKRPKDKKSKENAEKTTKETDKSKDASELDSDNGPVEKKPKEPDSGTKESIDNASPATLESDGSQAENNQKETNKPEGSDSVLDQSDSSASVDSGDSAGKPDQDGQSEANMPEDNTSEPKQGDQSEAKKPGDNTSEPKQGDQSEAKKSGDNTDEPKQSEANKPENSTDEPEQGPQSEPDKLEDSTGESEQKDTTPQTKDNSPDESQNGEPDN